MCVWGEERRVSGSTGDAHGHVVEVTCTLSPDIETTMGGKVKDYHAFPRDPEFKLVAVIGTFELSSLERQ